MRALIVSRTPEARAWMRSALGADHTADECANGLDALALLRDDDFDLLIADESTTPFGAFGLTKEVKGMPWPPGVIIVLDRTQDSWLASWSGADRWLVQPVDPFELRRTAIEVVDELDASVVDDAEAVTLAEPSTTISLD